MPTPRLYDQLLDEHFAGNRQMAFVSGPRQVGKTTTFQRQLRAPFAFQASVAADYVDADCFAAPGRPLAVPARTLLSQLL